MNSPEEPSEDPQASPSHTLFLVRAAGTGDQHAFRRLYRKNRDWLRASAALLIGEQLARVDVEDLLQETFAYAFRKIQNGEFELQQTEGAFRHYLGTILKNKAVDAARRAVAKKRGEGLEKAMRDVYNSTISELGIRADHATPSQIMMGNELAAGVGEAIAKLSEQDRQILHYRLVCQMPYEEILPHLASASGVAPKLGTAKSMFSRAKQKLLETLKDWGLVDGTDR